MVLIDIENCGGFSGSQRQFGGVQVRTVYIFLHIDTLPSFTTNLSCVVLGECSFSALVTSPICDSGTDIVTVPVPRRSFLRLAVECTRRDRNTTANNVKKT
jgi:hypothetical protein